MSECRGSGEVDRHSPYDERKAEYWVWRECCRAGHGDNNKKWTRYLVHDARKKEEQVRQRCWYLWSTKGGREEVLNHGETEKDEKETATK